jgi:hypothetical protein
MRHPAETATHQCHHRRPANEYVTPAAHEVKLMKEGISDPMQMMSCGPAQTRGEQA